MSTHEAQKIKDKIMGYNLFDTLSDRLKVIIKKSPRNPEGGVSDSMIYKAFRVGGKTATAITILNAAQQLIEDHEELIEEYIKDTSLATINQAAA